MTGRAQIAGIVAAGMLVAGAGGAWYGLKRQRHQQTMAALDHLLLPDRQGLQLRQKAILGGDLSPLARVKAIPLQDGEYRLAKEPLALAGLGAGEGEVALSVAKGAVHLHAKAPVTVNGSPTTDRDLSPGDLIILLRLRLMLTGTGQEPTLMVHDPQAPARAAFPGPAFYPLSSEYTFQGVFTPAPSGQTSAGIPYEAVRSGPHEVQAAGAIALTLAGKAYSLAAYRDAQSSYLMVPFRDPGSGPTGRYLYVPVPRAGEPVRLDFNQAWYPLCAYSKLYVCPPVPKGSELPAAIPAGEKTPTLSG